MFLLASVGFTPRLVPSRGENGENPKSPSKGALADSRRLSRASLPAKSRSRCTRLASANRGALAAPACAARPSWAPMLAADPSPANAAPASPPDAAPLTTLPNADPSGPAVPAICLTADKACPPRLLNGEPPPPPEAALVPGDPRASLVRSPVALVESPTDLPRSTRAFLRSASSKARFRKSSLVSPRTHPPLLSRLGLLDWRPPAAAPDVATPRRRRPGLPSRAP